MDEHYLMATVRYVELKPVKAKLCRHAEDWPWSSAQAHYKRQDDELVTVQPMLNRVGHWRHYLEQYDGMDWNSIRRASKSGRPAGNAQFLSIVEELTGVNATPLNGQGASQNINRYTVPGIPNDFGISSSLVGQQRV